MVIIVAAVLSLVAMILQPYQDKNAEAEKKQIILRSINVESTRENASELFSKYITESFSIDSKGNKTNQDAFKINLKEQYDKKPEDRILPVYKASKNDTIFIILPLWGKGLWGPLWGNIAFIENINETPKYNLVYGVTFDHKGETPGLGAEISLSPFQKQFFGKAIFDENKDFVSVKVIKNIGDSNPHAVDAISGGTITSNGVSDMIENCIKGYLIFIRK